MLPKLIDDCNQLLPDGAADSARHMGLCVHSTCHSTAVMLSRRLEAKILTSAPKNVQIQCKVILVVSI